MVGTLVATRARARNGRFAKTAKTVSADIAAQRMKQKLTREVKADEHSRGLVYEKGHYHALPNSDRMGVVETARILPLFERAA